MRIVTWNCNGAFRRKFQLLDHLGADVLIIQECEEPNESAAEYNAWAGNHLWTGAYKTKGLGIFVKGGHTLDRLDWPADGASLFLPSRVNNNLDIIGVWTQLGKSVRDGYVAQLWKYLQLNHINFGEKTLLAGDFNSNSQFDKLKQPSNH